MAILREPAERLYADELARLMADDPHPKPEGWQLSPRSVRSFVLGDPAREVRKKFYGDDALIDRCIVTLMSNRGLLLVGEPGTAKSMLSELLAAAISGDSTCTVQGTSGTTEDQITYSWNYALLLAEGPSRRALVRGPMHDAMELGRICRFEEVTRVQPEIQDALIGLLSDKVLHVPELTGPDSTVFAAQGFNVVASANIRDRGVHEMSSALKRRFNFETVRPISDRKLEARLIKEQTASLLAQSGVTTTIGDDVVELLVTAFHDLRDGVTADGAVVEKPTAVMSSAEAVAVAHAAALDATYFGNGEVGGDHVARQLIGTVLKDNPDDGKKLRHYFDVVVKQRAKKRDPQSKQWGRVLDARRELDPVISTRDVRELAGRLVTDALVVLPVRHHSPACALHVRDAIAQRRPSVVLVEGPRGFDPLIPLLADPAAQMPLAIYTWYVTSSDDPLAERASAYYPFCDYSPELVALREAHAAGVPARFIDLDFAEQALLRQTDQGAPDAGRSLLDERRFAHSRALQLLAERLGCRDHEDLWERLFEAAPLPLQQHVERMVAYCRLARLDYTDDDLRAEGTLQREAEMVSHVRAALDARRPGDGPVLVVLGGFHAVVLPDLLAGPPLALVGAPTGPTVPSDAALIRFTFERLERLNGYAAGMTSPAWHQLLWEHLSADAGPSTGRPRNGATLVALLDITRELRSKHQLPVSLPSVSAAYGQALQLAALRDRAAPLRSDLLDAVTSCFVKGDADVEGRLVLSASRRVLTGERVGVVPPGAGTPPLVADTLARLRAQRMKVDASERQTTNLDIYRRPAHRGTSRMLHGLELLGVPFAVRTAGPDFVRGHGLGRLQERWDYLWTPATDGSLAEASVFGSTLPEAVRAKFAVVVREFEQSSDRVSSWAAVSLLAHACVLGLHDHVDAALQLVRAGIASDAAFDAVALAATHLGLLWESREPLEARQLDALPDLIAATYARAIYLGRELQGQECEPRAVAEALMRLRELLVGSAGTTLDEELFWQLVERLRAHHDSALVRGAATGVAYSAGRLDDTGLAGAAQGHLSGTVPASEAVAFLGGLLLTAREAAWQNPQLVAGLDARLKAWDEETFVEHLPELRLAFATMTPVETDRIASSVARLHGLTELGPLLVRDADEGDVQRHLALSARVAELLAGDGLSTWTSGEGP